MNYEFVCRRSRWKTRGGLVVSLNSTIVNGQHTLMHDTFQPSVIWCTLLLWYVVQTLQSGKQHTDSMTARLKPDLLVLWIRFIRHEILRTPLIYFEDNILGGRLRNSMRARTNIL
jgi:hypothetical protein